MQPMTKFSSANPDMMGKGIAFAYVMNQMEVGALPGERVQGLVSALYC